MKTRGLLPCPSCAPRADHSQRLSALPRPHAAVGGGRWGGGGWGGGDGGGGGETGWENTHEHGLPCLSSVNIRSQS